MKVAISSSCAIRELGSGRILLTHAGSGTAMGVLRVTEWTLQGDEFIEFTNLGDAPLTLVGWVLPGGPDTSRACLTASGMLFPKESVIFAEASEALFGTERRLAAKITVIDDALVAAGQADRIHLEAGIMSLPDHDVNPADRILISFEGDTAEDRLRRCRPEPRERGNERRRTSGASSRIGLISGVAPAELAAPDLLRS